MKRIIKCSNAAFGYEGRIVADNLNFEVYEGDYIFVVGENGSGKSTLVKGILSLVPASKGEITFENGLTKNDIGYLPQQADTVKEFPASVEEVVISGCTGNNKRFFVSKQEKKLAYEKMELLNIYDIRKKSFSALSGGQRQRVLLARALCAAKKVIILDEPASNLDPVVTAEFYGLMKKINKEEKITVIMVSHDMKNTIKYAKKILHLGDKVNFFGDVNSYLSSSAGKIFVGGQRLYD